MHQKCWNSYQCQRSLWIHAYCSFCSTTTTDSWTVAWEYHAELVSRCSAWYSRCRLSRGTESPSTLLCRDSPGDKQKTTTTCANADCTALSVWNMKRASVLFGVGAFRPKFYGNGFIPCQNVDTVWQVVYYDTTVPLQVFRQWNSVADSMLLCGNLCNKNVKSAYLNPIFGKLGTKHNLSWWLIEKPMVAFPSMNCFCYLLWFQSYEVKCVTVQLGCFCQGLTFWHSDFTWTWSSPSNHSWHQKTRDTGLPRCEDRIPLHPSFWQYRSVTDGRTDRQTDGRICHSIYSACKASYAERCKNSH